MPYTIHDWFMEHAEVLARINDSGGITEIWIPFAALSENNYPSAWGERWPWSLDADKLKELGIRFQRKE